MHELVLPAFKGVGGQGFTQVDQLLNNTVTSSFRAPQ